LPVAHLVRDSTYRGFAEEGGQRQTKTELLTQPPPQPHCGERLKSKLAQKKVLPDIVRRYSQYVGDTLRDFGDRRFRERGTAHNKPPTERTNEYLRRISENTEATY
jgi:hypothetical protein